MPSVSSKLLAPLSRRTGLPEASLARMAAVLIFSLYFYRVGRRQAGRLLASLLARRQRSASDAGRPQKRPQKTAAVDREFAVQLLRLLRIMVPGVLSREGAPARAAHLHAGGAHLPLCLRRHPRGTHDQVHRPQGHRQLHAHDPALAVRRAAGPPTPTR